MECWGFESRETLPGEGFGLLIGPPPQTPAGNISVTLRPVENSSTNPPTGPTTIDVPITPDGSKTDADIAAITTAAEAMDAARLAPGRYNATWTENGRELHAPIVVPARTPHTASGNTQPPPPANTTTEPPSPPPDAQAARTSAEAARITAEAARIGAYSQVGGIIGQTLVGLQNASANQTLAAHSYGGFGGVGGFGGYGGFGDGIGFGTPAPFGGIGGGFGGYGSSGYGGGYGVGIDLSNNGFMIGQNSLDARAQKRAYDRVINQLLAAIKMGNIDMIRSALTFVTLKSKTTLIEASLHMVKAMQYYDTQTQQVVDQMGQLANRTNQDHAPGANNQPDNTNAQLGSLNARMNQYSMSRTAITNLTRDIMTMVQEMSDLENSVYSKRDRDSMHYRWA